MTEPAAAVYLREGTAVGADTFVGLATDPARSVVINACAGSGKTTLLVRRIVRCLLDGVEPAGILAITFTRAAAQEMQERVQAWLRRLAFASDDEVRRMLADDLMLGEAAASRVARARQLYEIVLTDRQGIELTTFHRWFWQLARLGAPVASADPVDELAENAIELVTEARLRWLDRLHDDPARRPIADCFDRAVEALGADTTRRLLHSFVEQRVEWQVSVADEHGRLPDLHDEAALIDRVATTHGRQWQQWAALLRERVPVWRNHPDARVHADGVNGAWLASGLRERLVAMAALLGQGGSVAVGIAGRMVDAQAALDALSSAQAAGTSVDPADTLAAWQGLAAAMVTDKRTPRAPGFQVRKFADALVAAGGRDAVEADWAACCEEVLVLLDLQIDAARALPLNRDLLVCGVSLVAAYQALKRERGVLDFVDLEAIAGRMLSDEAWASLLQVRLDRRYRQLMFDEFQDTSSLQWTVISQWLMAYAGAGSGEAPAVFVVGDPKQAIYRFRRAESRVFDAATELLREAFAAEQLTTATTHRNAAPIMQALNAAFDGAMPHYRAQATRAPAGPALVWRLPRPAGPERDARAGFDWLADLRDDPDNRHRDEGLAIGRAILAARAQLADAGRVPSWRDVIVLARSRAGFAACERALRSLGIPVVSDRRGGLLDALESGDLVALLQFARSAEDDLALARLLRSPLIGFSAARIGALAVGRSGTLFDRLRADPAADAQQAATRIGAWVAEARRLPIHDLFDRVVGEVDAELAYARCLEPAQRGIVVGNLRALIGLALDHDGGRYPGIDRFLDHIGALERLDDKDAPDEGRPAEADAVRLMTIHGSKGLEADLVVIADAAGGGGRDAARFVIDWPPDQRRPHSVGFRLDRHHTGRMARVIDETEAALNEVEDWNLLYVATTRARRGLIVSARAPGRAANAAGSPWYERLAGFPEPAGLPELAPDAGHTTPAGGEAGGRPEDAGSGDAGRGRFRGLALPPLGLGMRDTAASPASAGVDEAGPEAVVSLAMQAGLGLHAVLEWRTAGHGEDVVAAVLGQLGLPAQLAASALQLADRVLGLAELAPAFAGPGRNEFEIFAAGGQLLRLDRIARVGDALWVLDYKWSVSAALRPDYVAQLNAYRAAVMALPVWPDWIAEGGPVAVVRTVLVDATAGRAEFDPH